jgi:peptidoglycan/xylan/chitin deacetylase (PgdA/CDA1 family)
MFLIKVVKQNLYRTLVGFSEHTYKLEYRHYVTDIETIVFFTCDLEFSPELRAKAVSDYKLVSNVEFLIDILNKYDTKGIFFVDGGICQNYAEVIEMLYKDGHEIGSHGFAHIPMTSLWFTSPFPKFSSISARIVDIKKSKNAIKSIIGKEPISFRAPYLAIDDNMLVFLEKEGFLLDSSLYNPAFGKISFPYHPSKDDMISEGSLKILEVPLTVSPIPRRKFLHYRFPHLLELKEEQIERTTVMLNNLFHVMKYPFALFVVMIHPYELSSPSMRSRILTFLKIMKQNNALSFTSDQLIRKFNLAKSMNVK